MSLEFTFMRLLIFIFISAQSELCLTGVIVQFSTNNGVQWQLLRELDFGSFLEPQVVTIELPPAAKTPHTVFRWWQPQQGEQLHNTPRHYYMFILIIWKITDYNSNELLFKYFVQVNTQPSGVWIIF